MTKYEVPGIKIRSRPVHLLVECAEGEELDERYVYLCGTRMLDAFTGDITAVTCPECRRLCRSIFEDPKFLESH